MVLNVNSVSTNLPPTAYIKMIDCWLIFSLLKPMVDIILQTYLQSLRGDMDSTKVWNSVVTLKAVALGFMLVSMFARVFTTSFLVARGTAVLAWRLEKRMISWERLLAVGEVEPGRRRAEEEMK